MTTDIEGAATLAAADTPPEWVRVQRLLRRACCIVAGYPTRRPWIDEMARKVEGRGLFPPKINPAHDPNGQRRTCEGARLEQPEP